MQFYDQAEYQRRPVRCPIHGRVNYLRFVMPDPGDYFPAQYVCGHCEPVPASFPYLKLGEDIMRSTDYAGIDYGLGRTNVDHASGIRYGVISERAIGSAWYDSAEYHYAGPFCPKCGQDAVDATDDHEDFDQAPHSCADYACVTCRYLFGSDQAFAEEADGASFEDAEYTLTSCLDSDVMILKSPYYTRAQFCSPCVPGAGNLETPCATGPKTYCLGHEWYDDGKAPYPVFRVSDDTEVI